MASAWAAGPPKAAAPPSSADFALGSAVKLTTSDGEAVSGEARRSPQAQHWQTPHALH
jgi:hypothetical protein